MGITGRVGEEDGIRVIVGTGVSVAVGRGLAVGLGKPPRGEIGEEISEKTLAA